MWKERIQYQTYLYRDMASDLKKKAFEYPLVYGKNTHPPLLSGSSAGCWLSSRHSSNKLDPRVSLRSAKPAGSNRELPRGLRWVSPPVFSSRTKSLVIWVFPSHITLVFWVSPGKGIHPDDTQITSDLGIPRDIAKLFVCCFFSRSVCWKAFPFRMVKPKISNLSRTLEGFPMRLFFL